MFKLVHCEACSVDKWTVSLLLECFLVEVDKMMTFFEVGKLHFTDGCYRFDFCEPNHKKTEFVSRIKHSKYLINVLEEEMTVSV